MTRITLPSGRINFNRKPIFVSERRLPVKTGGLLLNAVEFLEDIGRGEIRHFLFMEI